MEPLHFDGQETYSVERNKSETKDWMIPRENNDCTYVEYHQKKKKKRRIWWKKTKESREKDWTTIPC